MFKRHTGILYVMVVFAILWYIRFAVSVGPLHDEAITMLAAKGMETSYAELYDSNSSPFEEIVPASDWHQFTLNYQPLSFKTIRDDVMRQDIHPPLAFWLYNLWLSLFEHGGYLHAVYFTGLMILLAGLLVYLCIWHLTKNTHWSSLGTLIFFMSNSALVTAIYVRQYALLSLWVVLCMFIIILLLKKSRVELIDTLLGFALGFVCLAGMLTQYLFIVVTIPMHLGLIGILIKRRVWITLSGVVLGYCMSIIGFVLLMPGTFARLLHKAEAGDSSAPGPVIWEPVSNLAKAFIHLPASLPSSIAFVAGILFFISLLVIGFILWRKKGESFPVASVRIIVAGFIGSCVLQVFFVSVGMFPPWATSSPYLCPLTILTTIALAVIGSTFKGRGFQFVVAGLCSIMILVQVAYVFKRVSTHNLLQIDFAKKIKPDLVLIDDLRRGLLLPLTMKIPGEQKVLATSPSTIEPLLMKGILNDYDQILYLMEDEINMKRRKFVFNLFKNNGWKVKQIPTLHPGMHEAFSIIK